MKMNNTYILKCDTNPDDKVKVEFRTGKCWRTPHLVFHSFGGNMVHCTRDTAVKFARYVLEHFGEPVSAPVPATDQHLPKLAELGRKVLMAATSEYPEASADEIVRAFLREAVFPMMTATPREEF